MKLKNKFIYMKKIKVYLVFFCVLLCFNCNQTKESFNIKTIKKERISFELSMVKLDDLSIVLKKHSDRPILGDWIINGTLYTFIPFLPFTEGESYKIKENNEVLYNFIIKPAPNIKPTKLVSIYPTQDSVPENLLKMYFVFSKPMQEIKNSLDYITVHDNTTNQDVSVFLELQSELWNKNHTVLTLWLDPGRIKTDLTPNKEKGLPILNGHNYTISISENWKDANNQIIDKSYNKTIYVTTKDDKKPETNKWALKTPKKNTKDPVIISFNETIDYFLGIECFNIINSENNSVNGEFKFLDKEQKLHFKPKTKWHPGSYSVSIETRLEDLAGNNLNYLFDTDLISNKPINNSNKYKSISFTID